MGDSRSADTTLATTFTTLRGGRLKPGISADAMVEVGNGRSICFATAEHGRGLLGASDKYTARLSDRECGLRMGVNHPVTEADYRSFASACVRDWTDADRRRACDAMRSLVPALAGCVHRLPAVTWLVRTTGQEEGGCGYTRGTAIVLPPQKIAYPGDALAAFIAHELFHVVTRRDPVLRDDLYATIGYRPCGEVTIPSPLSESTITNPDTPVNAHYVRAIANGVERALMPLPLWQESGSMSERRYVDSVVIRMLAIHHGPRGWEALEVDGRPILYDPADQNIRSSETGEDIEPAQPEEVLAEYFAALLTAGGPTSDGARHIGAILNGSAC